jgi:hypothetical protein
MSASRASCLRKEVLAHGWASSFLRGVPAERNLEPLVSVTSEELLVAREG